MTRVNIQPAPTNQDPSMKNTLPRLLVSVVPTVLSFNLHAAGGHHGVDDAAVMDEGQCKVEGWGTRTRGDGNLLHAGGGCRVGPVELGAAAEHARSGGAWSTGYGLQVKWAAPLTQDVSVGLLAGAGWQAHVHPSYYGSSLIGLLTWKAVDSVSLHVNLGRDFVHQGKDEKRWGVAAEWFAAERWSFVAEKFAVQAVHLARIGVRHAVNESFSVDWSAARALGGGQPLIWTLGATWVFDR